MQSIDVEDNTNATINYQVSTDGLIFKGWNSSIWDESTLMNSTQINALTSSELNLLFPDGANAVDFIVEDVRMKTASVEGVKDVNVNIVFEPAWDKDMMSEEAKLELGFL